MLYSFGRFELDLATCELRREGECVPLQPRVFGVLRFLIEHRDRVVGKQELIDALWGGYQLNTVAVPWTINRARKALGDQPDDSGYIETVRGYGYRFTADVLTSSEASPSPPTAAAPKVEQPFVGRAMVMQQLTQALSAAANGSGRLCLLSGEAGIGKTRCVDEFALETRRQGLQVWVGRCFQHGSAPAFWPFIQVLRAASSDGSVNERMRMEGLELLQAIEPRPPEAQGAAAALKGQDGERFWLLDRLSRWLCRSAASQARVIVLEDIHCADESSLQVLSLLAPMLRHARVLVIATARDMGAGLPRSAAALALRMRPCETLELLGLRDGDVETYLRSLLDDQLASRLAPALAARSAGNPLFLHELARVVCARYAQARDVQVADLPLPAAVTEIIGARLRELDPGTRSLLDVACVTGEELGISVLQRASGRSASDVLAALEAATLADALRRRSDGLTYTFTHPLVREVLYEALSAMQRASLHAAVAEALEALGLAKRSLYELAYHFHHAPLEACYAKARRYGRLAGEAAMRALAYDEAVQCYVWALEAQLQLAPDAVSEVCDLLLISASALGLAGRDADARRHCRRAIELAHDAKLPEILVRAARQRRLSVWMAQIPDPMAKEALELALRLLPEQASRTRAQAYAHLAVFPPYALNVEAGRRISAEAVRLARELDDPQLMHEVHATRLFGLCAPDNNAELLVVAETLLQQDPRQNLRFAVDGHFARYHALMLRGEGAQAEHSLEAFARLASALRLPFSGWHCERLRAQRTLHAGDLDAAERRFSALWLESQRMQLPLAASYYSASCRALSLERTGVWRRDRAMPEPAPWMRVLPGYRARSLLESIDAGELVAAARELRTLAADDFAEIVGDVYALAHLALLSRAAIALHDRPAVLALRERLAPYAQLTALTAFTSSLGSVSRYLGLLEGFLGQRVQAQAYFELAGERNARSGHELERLRANMDLARLLAKGRASERVRARTLAADVADRARACGALALVAAARELHVGGAAPLDPTRARSSK
jgi:DNA-binding winged helix-turn-helix (wHTH) protein/tetratricopeptide (TPR) repeat protein